MPRVRQLVGRRPAQVPHTVLAVDVPGVGGGLEKGAVGAPGDWHVEPSHGVEDGQRVAHDIVHGSVATDAGDRPQVQPPMRRGQQQGRRVVDAGVDVENHGPDASGPHRPASHRLPTRRG